MPSAPATWPGVAEEAAVELQPALVDLSSRCCAAGARPRRGRPPRRTGAARAGLRNSTFAMGGKSCPAMPPKGSSAPLSPTRSAGAIAPSSVMRISMAAPAEWPTATWGVSSSVASSVRDRARHAGQRGAAARKRAGEAVAREIRRTTVKCSASRGARPRQECVAAPVPCSSSSGGPVAHHLHVPAQAAGLHEAARRRGSASRVRPSPSRVCRGRWPRRPHHARAAARTACDRAAASACGKGR